MKVFKGAFILLLGLLGTTVAIGAAPSKVMVFAASSLQEAVKAIEHQDKKPVIFSFAGSGTLAHQINQGAPADLFLCANLKWAQWLLKQRKLSSKNICPFARNHLVLVTPKGHAPITLSSFLKDVRLKLAIATPQVAPAGTYAQEVLQNTKMWNSLVANHQLILTPNVRATLALGERNEVDGAIVYSSDLKASALVVKAQQIDDKLHSPIAYYALKLTNKANSIFTRLCQNKYPTVLRQNGFAPPK